MPAFNPLFSIFVQHALIKDKKNSQLSLLFCNKFSINKGWNEVLMKI